jgi:hypothetical protein
MKVNFKSYPHPVLGNEDDLGGYFSVEFHYELSKDEVALNPCFNLKNQGLEVFIKDGLASYVTEVQCPASFFRASFASKKPINRFVVPAKLLREKVVVEFYICANEDIQNYKPSECHPDYAGASFDIEKGDILATGGSCSFIAEKDFDPLRPPVSSFMSITEGSHHEGPMEIDYESEKITIVLSKEDWKNYTDIRGQKVAEGILHSSIVLPVLIDAIHRVQKGNSDYGDKNWFGRLEAILDAKKILQKEPFESAQKILDNPMSRSFQGIGSLLEITNENEQEYGQ